MTLRCDNLILNRDGKCVLRGLSASFEPGQITAIVGPNGAGKSSALMALAGLLEPQAGGVMLGDAALEAIAPSVRAKQIGYLPQSAQIAWDVAVEELVALGRYPHRDTAQEPIENAIAVMGLEELRTRPASKLSGGERARVLLARVLAGTPQWVLADEPLAALDLAHQLSLIAYLKACAKDGLGVVIVLHDLALAMNHADRVIVLSEGKIAAQGEPELALSSDVIATVWKTQINWLGKPGQRAFAAL